MSHITPSFKPALTPAIKGQLTKASKVSGIGFKFSAVRRIFSKIMPAEQAKHATRKYLASIV